MSKKLIAFYSRGDKNYVCSMLKNLDIGNTEVAAGMIKELTGADMFRIEQAAPYSKGYNDCIDEAKSDQQNDVRPELKSLPDSLDEYDVIYLGYPNYWSTMPMAVFTFLESFDFGGKTIMPFCTHEGSGMGKSVSDIRRICPDADVKNGLAIYGYKVKDSIKDIKSWI